MNLKLLVAALLIIAFVYFVLVVPGMEGRSPVIPRG